MIKFSAAALTRARQARGLKVEHLAIATGRSSFSVRLWEQGRVVPPTAIVGQLADALSIPVADLFEQSDPNAAA